MTKKNQAKSRRVFDAMMKMDRIDIKTLKQAYNKNSLPSYSPSGLERAWQL